MSHPALSAQVRSLISRAGVVGAARQLGLSRESVARLAADLDVRPGTRALAEQRLTASSTTHSEPPHAA